MCNMMSFGIEAIVVTGPIRSGLFSGKAFRRDISLAKRRIVMVPSAKLTVLLRLFQKQSIHQLTCASTQSVKGAPLGIISLDYVY